MIEELFLIFGKGDKIKNLNIGVEMENQPRQLSRELPLRLPRIGWLLS